MENRFFPVIGNKDYCTKGGEAHFKFFTGLPGNGRYFTFSKGPVDFFAVNSEIKAADDYCNCPKDRVCWEPDGSTVDSVQAKWLQKALKASKAPWKVVFFHHAPFSCSVSSTWMQWPFRKWGAHVVLAGHKHRYERGFYNGKMDFPYIVTGAGGTDLSDCSKSAIDRLAKDEKFDEIVVTGYYGSIKANASDTGMTLEFVEAVNGTVMDSCVFKRKKDGSTSVNCNGKTRLECPRCTGRSAPPWTWPTQAGWVTVVVAVVCSVGAVALLLLGFWIWRCKKRAAFTKI